MYYRDEDPNRTGDLDYFAGFLNKLTHQDADDLEFYEKPPVLSPRIFRLFWTDGRKGGVSNEYSK